MKNIVFYFSGTGNCLKVAQGLAAAMGGATLYSMGAAAPEVPEGAQSVGFVYPVYFWGQPLAVQRFADALSPESLAGKYLYAVVTYGGDQGNGLRGFAAMMKRRGTPLDYGAAFKMFSNYVLMYDMKTDVAGITEKADAEMGPIIADIAARRKNKIGRPLPFAGLINKSFAKSAHSKDEGYAVSDSCTGCGVCAMVCPVSNIQMRDGRPAYAHRCEVCVACIQYCPVRAIDYKDKTQARGRYHHPGISAAELSMANRQTF